MKPKNFTLCQRMPLYKAFTMSPNFPSFSVTQPGKGFSNFIFSAAFTGLPEVYPDSQAVVMAG